MLYDLVQCSHRPAIDLFGDPAKRDEINAFVQLLWEKGSAFEHEVIDDLKLPMLDLSRCSGDEKERLTFEATIGTDVRVQSILPTHHLFVYTNCKHQEWG